MKELKRCIKITTIDEVTLMKSESDDEEVLKITTTDYSSFKKISKKNNWPPNAFGTGVKLHVCATNLTVTILGVDPKLNISNENPDMAKLIRNKGMLKPNRIYNYINGAPDLNDPTNKIETSMLTISDYIKMLTTPFYITNNKITKQHKVVPTIRHGMPCKKCLSITHSSKYCTKEQKCMKCTEAHHQTECKAINKKCSNCSENHMLSILLGNGVIKNKHEILKNKKLHSTKPTNSLLNSNSMNNTVKRMIREEMIEVAGRVGISESNILKLNSKMDMMNENMIAVNNEYGTLAEAFAGTLSQ